MRLCWLLVLLACSAPEPGFVELPGGKISSQVRIQLDNPSAVTRRYYLVLADSPGALIRSNHMWTVPPRKSLDIPLYIEAPRKSFTAGRRKVYLRIHGSDGAERVVTLTLRGPR
jgi:hypothetical protein